MCHARRPTFLCEHTGRSGEFLPSYPNETGVEWCRDACSRGSECVRLRQGTWPTNIESLCDPCVDRMTRGGVGLAMREGRRTVGMRTFDLILSAAGLPTGPPAYEAPMPVEDDFERTVRRELTAFLNNTAENEPPSGTMSFGNLRPSTGTSADSYGRGRPVSRAPSPPAYAPSSGQLAASPAQGYDQPPATSYAMGAGTVSPGLPYGTPLQPLAPVEPRSRSSSQSRNSSGQQRRSSRSGFGRASRGVPRPWGEGTGRKKPGRK